MVGLSDSGRQAEDSKLLQNGVIGKLLAPRPPPAGKLPVTRLCRQKTAASGLLVTGVGKMPV
jgi:hypothetical protein